MSDSTLRRPRIAHARMGAVLRWPTKASLQR